MWWPKYHGPLNKDPYNGEVFRASGDVICEICGKLYYDHPEDHFSLGYNGKPYNHVICDGTRVHL
jgi:hypothetical protein